MPSRLALSSSPDSLKNRVLHASGSLQGLLRYIRSPPCLPIFTSLSYFTLVYTSISRAELGIAVRFEILHHELVENDARCSFSAVPGACLHRFVRCLDVSSGELLYQAESVCLFPAGDPASSGKLQQFLRDKSLNIGQLLSLFPEDPTEFSLDRVIEEGEILEPWVAPIGSPFSFGREYTLRKGSLGQFAIRELFSQYFEDLLC